MKKIFVMLALTMGVVSANAQSVDSTAVTNTVAGDVTLTTDIYPQQEDGDIYHGLTKKLTFDRMIPPHKARIFNNVTFSLKNKTDIIKTKIGEVYRRITATEAPLSKIV